MPPLRTLILGGYGSFGARIACAVVRDPRIELLIGGRDGARATMAAERLGSSDARGVAIDAEHDDLASALQANESARVTTSLPTAYWTLVRRWEWLGYPAVIAMLVTLWLMVAKPTRWLW